MLLLLGAGECGIAHEISCICSDHALRATAAAYADQSSDGNMNVEAAALNFCGAILLAIAAWNTWRQHQINAARNKALSQLRLKRPSIRV